MFLGPELFFAENVFLVKELQFQIGVGYEHFCVKKHFQELRRKEQAEQSNQGVINVQSDLDWKRDETSRILEGLGLPDKEHG